MSEPLRIWCPSPNAFPSVTEMAEWVTRGRHMVLHLPPGVGGLGSEGKASLISGLVRRLPEEFSVFDSGGYLDGSECITVLRVLSRSEVLLYEVELVQAARHFRHTAREWCVRLAGVLRVPLVHFWTTLFQRRVAEEGRLDRNWDFSFHGLECCFSNQGTGEVVEVSLGYPDEFGVLDPYFFTQFLQHTDECKTVRLLFQDTFHDCARALDILESRGRLRRIARCLGPGSGLVASD